MSAVPVIPVELDALDRRIINRLQDSFPISESPYADVAAELRRLSQHAAVAIGVVGPDAAADVGSAAPNMLLAAIHDAEIEEAIRAAYGRDYAAFGFGDWR